jgi:hypothetical protein
MYNTKKSSKGATYTNKAPPYGQRAALFVKVWILRFGPSWPEAIRAKNNGIAHGKEESTHFTGLAASRAFFYR